MNTRSMLVVLAHPDDESFSIGGTKVDPSQLLMLMHSL